MTFIQKSLDICHSYADATISFVKDPVRSFKHAAWTFKTMDTKELTLVALKIAAAALLAGLIGLGIGAAFGIITPGLSFIAIPLSLVGTIFGGLTMAAYIAQQARRASDALYTDV